MPEEPQESRELRGRDRSGELVDGELLEEIELLADVITGVAGYAGRLTPGQLDEVLGLCDQAAHAREHDKPPLSPECEAAPADQE